MRAHPLPEARYYADMMLVELRKVIPSFLRRVDVPERGVKWSDYLSTNTAAMTDIVDSIMGDVIATDVDEVTLIDFDALGVTRGQVMRQLSAEGIGTQVHYLPVYRQPYYRETSPVDKLPGADGYYRRTLSLPLFPAMQDSDVHRVCEALAAALRF
jgi:hypothetical protein